MSFALKYVILAGFMTLSRFLLDTLQNEYHTTFANVRVLSGEPAISFDVKYKKLDLKGIVWHFTDREFSILPNNKLVVKYKHLIDLLNCNKVRVMLKLDYCRLELLLNSFIKGILTIEGTNHLKGTVKFNYNFENHEAVLQKTDGTFEFPAIAYILDKDDDMHCAINQNGLKLDSKKLSMIAGLWPEKLTAKCFLQTPIVEGNANLNMEQTSSLKIDLKYLKIVELCMRIGSLFDGMDLRGPKSKISNINLDLACKIDSLKFMFGEIRNVQAVGSIVNGKVKSCNLEAKTINGKDITIKSHDFGILFGDCTAADEIVNLFSPGTVKQGLLKASLDLLSMRWRFDIFHAKLPMLAQIQIKYLMSPLRWMRMVIHDPSEIDLISGNGRFLEDMTLIVTKIHGTNHYYNLNMHGIVDFMHDTINLDGTLAAGGDVKAAVAPKDRGFFKDSVTFSIKGTLLEPKFKFGLAPWSVLSALFQPILY